jgi:amidase
VTDVAIVLDATVGYDPDDAQTAASVGHVPNSYTDFLKLNGLHGARIGVLNELFQTAPADEQVNAVISAAVQDMKKSGAEAVDVEIPGLRDLLTDRGSSPGWIIIRQDFKADFNAYLDAHPTAPVRSLAEVIASKKFHPFLQNVLNGAEAVESRDTKDYLEQVVKIGTVRDAVLKAMADNRVDALVYPTLTSKPSMIGQAGQTGFSNCRLSPSSGLPAMVVPGGFTPDGIPVGVEFIGRPWSEPQLISFAYSYEQSTRHRRPPASTPPLPAN